jgi:hypothetical protein
MPANVSSIVVTQKVYNQYDPTYIPTVTVSYKVDAATIGLFQCAHIYYAIDRGSGYSWLSAGYDYSKGSGFDLGLTTQIKSGDIVRVSIAVVNKSGVEQNQAVAPTGYMTIASVGTLPTPTNLVLETGGTSWNGRKFSVSWAPQNDLDAYNVTNEVVINIAGTDRLTVKTKDNRFEYVYGDGSNSALDSYLLASNGACTV